MASNEISVTFTKARADAVYEIVRAKRKTCFGKLENARRAKINTTPRAIEILETELAEYGNILDCFHRAYSEQLKKSM